MANTAYFTPDCLRFLADLKAHNDRDWFNANKARYEKSVRDPFLRLVTDLGPRLQKLNRHFVADPRPVGGSMMRIYRDTRFSKDKSPYKSAVMARFWHDEADEGATPAFYLRLAPGNCALGAGVWQPEPGALARIRDAIAGDPKTWTRVKGDKAFRAACSMAGESLKRPPAGFDADHPCIEDLKRKDFALVVKLGDKQVSGASFMDELLGAYKSSLPFLGFLTRAVGLPF
jgi:uncharacterized protein (TIGR02453 family)